MFHIIKETLDFHIDSLERKISNQTKKFQYE